MPAKYASKLDQKSFNVDLTITVRALVEDLLVEKFHVPLTETHNYIGDYSLSEVE